MWKDVVVAYFKVYQHLPGELGETGKDRSQDSYFMDRDTYLEIPLICSNTSLMEMTERQPLVLLLLDQ
jgi:hypothetical protein